MNRSRFAFAMFPAAENGALRWSGASLRARRCRDCEDRCGATARPGENVVTGFWSWALAIFARVVTDPQLAATVCRVAPALPRANGKLVIWPLSPEH